MQREGATATTLEETPTALYVRQGQPFAEEQHSDRCGR